MARIDENKEEQPQQQQQFQQPGQVPNGAHLPPHSYQQPTAPPPSHDHHQYYQQPPPAGMMYPPPPPPAHYQAPPIPQPGIPMPSYQFSMTPQLGMKQGWQTDLFGCLDDPENALITLCCPCVTFGQIAEILDNGQTSCATSGMLYSLVLFCIAMPCLLSCAYRTKLRARYNLVETPAPDWLTHFCCEPCALCQAYRELNARGVEPSLGWHGNLQQQQNAMVPPANNGMMYR